MVWRPPATLPGLPACPGVPQPPCQHSQTCRGLPQEEGEWGGRNHTYFSFSRSSLSDLPIIGGCYCGVALTLLVHARPWSSLILPSPPILTILGHPRPPLRPWEPSLKSAPPTHTWAGAHRTRWTVHTLQSVESGLETLSAFKSP